MEAGKESNGVGSGTSENGKRPGVVGAVTSSTTPSKPQRLRSAVAANTPAASLSKKLNKLLQSHDELFRSAYTDTGIVMALRGLSEIYSEEGRKNTKFERQKLRSHVETRAISVNQRFLDAFLPVKEKLLEVEAKVEEMKRSCEDMTLRLRTAQEDTSELIEKTTQLQDTKATLDTQRKVLDSFFAEYQLSADEQEALSGSKPLDEHFFEAFEKLKAIYKRSSRLLRTRRQRAGVDIMNEMAERQERAYQRLYAWTQASCRGLTTQAVDRTSLLYRAFAALKERDVLYRYAISDLTTTRRLAISRGFNDALTKGGPTLITRPLEYDSHDAVLYTSGMLGWLHQAMASERDLVSRVLFSREKAHVSSLAADEKSVLLSALDTIMEGACRPFKTRMTQVLSSDLSLLSAFRIEDTLSLYASLSAEIIGESAKFCTLLGELKSDAEASFASILESYAQSLLSAEPEIPSGDLYPPSTLENTLAMIQDILSSRSPTASATNAITHKMLDMLVMPLLQMCTLNAASLGPADMAAYMVNCIYRITTLLQTFDVEDSRQEMLSAQSDAHIDTLVNAQAQFLVHKSGLADVLSAYQAWQGQGSAHPMSDFPNLNETVLRSALAHFDDFLASADLTMLPQGHALHSASVRDRIQGKAVELFVATLDEFRATVLADQSGYSPALIEWEAEQVKSLLT